MAMSGRQYETVPGFFIQDSPDRLPGPVGLSTQNEILPRLGLIDERPDRWSTFTAAIHSLNATATRGVQYKVFFIGRHGEGFHNVAEAKYGKKAWDEYWSKLNGDGEMVWGPDPQLTPLGEQQAWDAHVAWETERRFGIPVPEKLYTSPLTRAIRTSQITFDNLIVCDLRTTINVREQHGIHTCDKRRTRSEIHDAFPEYTFEDGFTEADLLWKPDYRETHADVDRRVTRVLDDIFQNGHEQCRSVSLQRVLGAALRADGPFSYIDHDAWRFRRGILAGVSPLPLVSSHRR
ncbi:histidine phosphatase superfamily [Boletus reticuloceps]|uniref:Histidine phosphatase superfamily n=1 Tax=Boletus reticuloceps TaxID=495285 RepID=A0A8I2YCM2_9AGAM|nr:histidine phosphatase superfamily [Boletus reticuloceps]